MVLLFIVIIIKLIAIGFMFINLLLIHLISITLMFIDFSLLI